MSLGYMNYYNFAALLFFTLLMYCCGCIKSLYYTSRFRQKICNWLMNFKFLAKVKTSEEISLN